MKKDWIETAESKNLLMDMKIIDELDLSNKAYNVCKNAGLLTLKDIVDYYEKNDSFRNIRSCGEKVDRELMIIVERSRNLDRKQFFDLSNLNGAFTIDDLKVLENLTPRAYHVCKNENLLCLKNIVSYFQKYNNFTNIKDCDIPTNLELLLLIKKNVLDLAKNRDVSNSNLVLNFVEQKFFVKLSDHLPNFEDNYKHQNLPFLKILDIIIKQGWFFNLQDKEILTNLYTDKIRSITEIAANLNVTGEAIRLRMLTLTKELFYDEKSVVNTLLVLFKKSFENYLIKTNRNVIAYNKSFIKKFNQANQTNFSNNVIIAIMSIYYKDYLLIRENTKKDKVINEFSHQKEIYFKNYYFCRGEDLANYFPIYMNYLTNILKKKKKNAVELSIHEILKVNNEDYRIDYYSYKKRSNKINMIDDSEIPIELQKKYANSIKLLKFIIKNEFKQDKKVLLQKS